MPRTFVIPDLHGRRDLLELALARITSAVHAGAATLIVLGDYVDKGPDSRGVIARLRAGMPGNTSPQGSASTPGSAPSLWRMATIKGNHDALMVAALRGQTPIENWLGKGGDVALASYGGEVADVPEHDIDWLDGRPLFHEDAHRVYVHAGVDPALPLRQQDPATLMTKRYADDDDVGLNVGLDIGLGAKHVVHGHDRHPDGPLLLTHRSNLDTNAWKTGRLVIGVFDDDLPGGPVEVIEIVGLPRD